MDGSAETRNAVSVRAKDGPVLKRYGVAVGESAGGLVVRSRNPNCGCNDSLEVNVANGRSRHREQVQDAAESSLRQ